MIPSLVRAALLYPVDTRSRVRLRGPILKDTPIIILDEATSSVDPENEAELQQAIEKLTEDKTVIIIAHRLKTVAMPSRLLLLQTAELSNEVHIRS